MALTISNYFAFITIIHTQLSSAREELIYSCGFDTPQGWTEDEGSFDPNQHQYDPIVWYQGGLDYYNCPRYSADPSVTNAYCVRLFNDASISRIISTVGYHSIRLKVDINPQHLETGEVCYMRYRTAKTDWAKSGVFSLTLDFHGEIVLNQIVNNESTFEVKLGVNAGSGGDSCLFDNLRVFGIRYTASPTRDPTSNPTQPSSNPTVSTNKPSFETSVSPSSYPSNAPSILSIATDVSTQEEKKETGDEQGLSMSILIQISAIVLGLCCCCCIVWTVLVCRRRKERTITVEYHPGEISATLPNASYAGNEPGLYVMKSMRREGDVKEANELIKERHDQQVACLKSGCNDFGSIDVIEMDNAMRKTFVVNGDDQETHR
eukprot:186285_1